MTFEFKINKDTNKDINKDINKDTNKDINKDINKKELSPKMRKRINSMDNFFKFQWNWTL
jgi:hypothetical protein